MSSYSTPSQSTDVSTTSDTSSSTESTTDGATTDTSNSGILAMLGFGSDEVSEQDLDAAGDLVTKFGQDRVIDWIKEVAGGWKDSPELYERIGSRLVDAHDLVDRADKINTAIETMANTNAGSSPGQKLMEIHAIFDLLYAFCPYIPGFHEFMEGYLTIMETFATSLDELAETISNRYRNMGDMQMGDGDYSEMVVPDADVFSGGEPLHNYLFETIHINDYAAKTPPDDVTEWVKDNRDMLSTLTGEKPAAEQQSTFGIDWLNPDEVNEEELTAWFGRHASKIADAIYGSLQLSRFIYEGVPMTAGNDE